MTITEATIFFNELLKNSDSRREIKVYKEFITILTNLKSRDFTEVQLVLIEDTIAKMNLESNPGKKRRYFSKQLSEFKKFLKTNFSLITEGYYATLGMSLGMCFGLAIGTSLEGAGNTTGLLLGMIIGYAFGRKKDKEAMEDNNVLKN
jgi:hypothetical protein